MSKNNGQSTSTKYNVKNEMGEKSKIKSEKQHDGNNAKSDDEKPNSSAKRKLEILPLLVSNFPEKYTLFEITDFLVKKCGPCEVSLSDDKNEKVVEAIFGSTSVRSAAKKALSSQSINDVKLRVESPTPPDGESDLEENEEGPQAKRKKGGDEGPWGIDMDVWRPDPKGWYGVKPEYLTSLGIEGSLQNWVLVKNFRCSKEDLKEVLSLAGEVVMCVVTFANPNSYARVMYRHPLEALQAVSMLNGQKFNGLPLTVRIIKTSCNGILPKGLNNLGPGLSKNGKPLTDILKQYERFLKGQENELNNSIFRTPEEQCSDDHSTYSKNEDDKNKAKEALETLVALVNQGMEVDDIMTVLKSIKGNENLSSVVEGLKDDAKPSTPDSQNSGKKETANKAATMEKNRTLQSSPTSSISSGSPSRSPSPKNAKVIKAPQANTAKSRVSQQISTVINRPKPKTSGPTIKAVPASKLFKPAPSQPAAPGTGPSYAKGQNNKGPSGPRGPISGPNRTLGPMFTGNPGPMAGPTSGPMSGPMSSPMSGPMSGPMGGPMSGPMGGPMSGPMSGPMCGPMSGPMSGPMIGPMNGPMGGPMSGPMGGPMSGPMGGPMSGPMGGPMSGPMGGPMSGPMGGPNFSGPNQPSFDNNGPSTGEARLQFSNLPLSTTFALLSEKLSQVGQLLSIQFTTPGCVVASFAHREHAERCRQQFDGSRLEGNLIGVRFI